MRAPVKSAEAVPIRRLGEQRQHGVGDRDDDDADADADDIGLVDRAQVVESGSAGTRELMAAAGIGDGTSVPADAFQVDHRSGLSPNRAMVDTTLSIRTTVDKPEHGSIFYGTTFHLAPAAMGVPVHRTRRPD